ncbi:MAG: DUF4367 domain-containing protein [Lachnospiraceae bacterium]|nr:DUF4367 domain-containing protein [Lachnospiraceae bacterium]MDD5853324.1 DUF4367 domain-containing protein [Lachnospiraceae bacterium]
MKAKRLMLILLCTTVVGAFTACGAKSSETDGAGQNESNVVSEVETNDGEADEENTQIANPWVDCASMEDAVKIAGFSFEVPKQIEGYPNQVIQAIENDIIQVIYDDGTNSIYIRKGAGTEDISGDYNEYEQSDEVSIGEYQVTEKGNDGKVSVAIWNDENYSFCVGTPGMSAEEIAAIIEQVK